MQNGQVLIRVDDDIKDQATQALSAMGMSVSDAVRLFLRRVVMEVFLKDCRLRCKSTFQLLNKR